MSKQATYDHMLELARKQTALELTKVHHEDDARPLSGKHAVCIGMADYVTGGTFTIPCLPHLLEISNPFVTTEVFLREGKAHTSRMIHCVERVRNLQPHPNNYAATAFGKPLGVWWAVEEMWKALSASHDGAHASVDLRGRAVLTTYGLATGLASAIPLELVVGCWGPEKQPGYRLVTTLPIHTVCPSMIHTADGHSHTQRALVRIEVTSNEAPSLQPLIQAVLRNFQVCQAAMKIPDEALHCLEAYRRACYVEDIVTIIANYLVGHSPLRSSADGYLHVSVDSQESIFPNNLTAQLEVYLERSTAHVEPAQTNSREPRADEASDRAGDEGSGRGLPGLAGVQRGAGVPVADLGVPGTAERVPRGPGWGTGGSQDLPKG